ncbi:MFS transporter [Nesterenkonia sp. HG001]|uniref:MFS transporter n=1 Tax=Nesterenkonia sp. HG001 TaxID=2983207 RepID=UPI002AC64CE7|nr:MFS transporter [Nesterenkonia sp. HG001]MDZ5077112.1 MFS transporter [Nesterenkonia sp. HG001]
MTQARAHPLSRHLLGTLLVLGAVMLVGGTDMTKVVVALPELAEELSLSAATSLWVADVYPLAAGVALVLSAVAADRFGRRRIYVLGLVIAILSAMIVGFAPGGGLVIAGRIGQGVGAALLIAGTVAIIRVSFPGVRLRALAYGVWVTAFSTGSALGPLLGGGLVELAHWRWVFWINVPVLALCLIAALLVLQDSKNPDPPSLDGISAALSGFAVGLVIAGLKAMAQPQLPLWLSLAALAAGAAAAVMFVVRQTRLPRPFLDVSLLTNALLGTSAAVIAATLGVFSGVLYLLTQRYQVIEGLSAVQAGVALIPLAVSSAAGGLLGPLLLRWSSQQRIITAGLVLAAGGFLLLATLDAAGELAALVILGLGSGIIMAIAANAIMSTAPESRTADAGAIQETSFALGAGTGIAALGTLAIHHGVIGQGAGTGSGASAAAIYGPGVDAALGLGAFLYAAFALGAGLIILSTAESGRGQHAVGPRRAPSVRQPATDRDRAESGEEAAASRPPAARVAAPVGARYERERCAR